MKTPNEYKHNLDQKIITRKMLGDCIFALNTRAIFIGKQIADNYFTNDVIQTPEQRTQEIKALCVKKNRYYKIKRNLLKIIKPTGVLICEKTGKVYKTYNLDDTFSFCSTVNKKYLNSYKGPISYIDSFPPKQVNLSEILSMQFINKVHALIKSKDFIIDEDLIKFVKRKYKNLGEKSKSE